MNLLFMLLVLAVKTYVLGGCMTPIAFAVLGTGILFGCYNLAASSNKLSLSPASKPDASKSFSSMYSGRMNASG